MSECGPTSPAPRNRPEYERAAPAQTIPGASPRLSWVVVVPVKGSALSKSRLAPVPLDGAERRRLALAFALDTVSAILAAPDVRAVVVVTADPESSQALGALGPVSVLTDAGEGLNPAISMGLAHVLNEYPDAAVAVMTADLPTLTPLDVSQALGLAAEHPLAFVHDADGIGTTTITALPGHTLVPRFGLHSARLHAEGGLVPLEIPADSSLRRDVDTPGDLLLASTLAVGAHTAAVLGAG